MDKRWEVRRSHTRFAPVRKQSWEGTFFRTGSYRIVRSYSLTSGSTSSERVLTGSEDSPLCPFPHLVQIHQPEHVEIPIICVGTALSIYTLMASAVLQRREFGILDPVIGIASAPGTRATAVHVMFGWVEPFGDNCVSYTCLPPSHLIVCRSPSTSPMALLVLGERTSSMHRRHCRQTEAIEPVPSSTCKILSTSCKWD